MSTSPQTIHAAQVAAWGEPPKYVSIPAPPAPDAETVQIRLLAAGVHQIVRSRAAGTHYTSKSLPHIPGTDGVGLTIPDNKLVHFVTMTTGGSFAEILNVPKRDVNYLPVEAGITEEKRDELAVKIAALANPALSSWMALKKRTQNLPQDWTVLIMGVTSASGRIAIDVARHMGAKKVIGLARNEATLQKLVSPTGLDSYIVLQSKVEDTDFSPLGDVDVVLDYVYGAPAEQLFRQLKSKVATQYVQIGSLAGLEISLPSAALRARDLTIRGSGPGAFDLREMGREMPGILKAVLGMRVDGGLVREVKLSEVETAWGEKEAGRRLVFVP